MGVCSRFHVFVLCVVLGLVPSSVLARPFIEPAPRCFVETGQCVHVPFLHYWEQNGGVAVFGLPITAARPEINPDTGQSYLTQWFERNRFEYHPDQPAPDDVQLSRLGVQQLDQFGLAWRTLPRSPRPGGADCLQFHVAGTEHWVCDQAPGAGFATYWRTHGLHDPRLSSDAQSLALFGLPLTEPRMETNSSGDRVLTQWFEGARFEWHPRNPRAFNVLLGRLGAEMQPGAHPARLQYFWPR